MAGKGGGAWKVAYADFVTAMMAFFMVMWLVSQSQQTKEAVAKYFRDPFAMQDGKTAGNGKVHLLPTRLRQSAPSDQGEGAKVRNQNGLDDAARRTQAPLLEAAKDDRQFSIMFPLDGAAISPTEQATFDSSVETLVGKFNRVEIRGHCLRKPLPEGSDFKDHWQLCYARCVAVKEELEKRGVEPWRIRLSQAEGNEPLTSTLKDRQMLRNSRVDVFMLADITHMPWRDALAEDEATEAHPPAAAKEHHEAPHEAAPPAEHAAKH